MAKYSLTELAYKKTGALRNILRKEYGVSIDRSRKVSRMDLIEWICDCQDGKKRPDPQQQGEPVQLELKGTASSDERARSRQAGAARSHPPKSSRRRPPSSYPQSVRQGPKRLNINSLKAYRLAHLKKGDICDLVLVNNSHLSAAVYIGAYHAHWGTAPIIGMTFLIGNQRVDIEFDSINSCHRV